MAEKQAEAKQTIVNKPVLAKTHMVKKGDTFHGIATKYGLSFAMLKEFNNDSTKLEEGQSLNLED